MDYVVLLQDKEVHHNNWSMGAVNRTFSNYDGKVQKIEVRISGGGQLVHYVRPITSVEEDISFIMYGGRLRKRFWCHSDGLKTVCRKDLVVTGVGRSVF